MSRGLYFYVIVAKFQKIKCWRIKECTAATLRNYVGAYSDVPKSMHCKIQVMAKKRTILGRF